MDDMKSESSDRREFLTGKAAARALDAARPDDDRCVPVERFEPILEVSRRAMACEFAVLLPADNHGPATEIALAALDVVEQIEDQLTVYRESSEVSQVNRLASSQPVKIAADLCELIQESIQIHAATDGAFDITAGPLSKLWGFHHRAGQLPETSIVEPTLNRVGSQWLEVNEKENTIRFARSGMEINFGAIGKGYALDESAKSLRNAGLRDYMMHGGMSSILAAGRRSESEDPKGWRVAVRNPVATHERLLEITLEDQALATSGSANQFFYFQGRRFSHVIDPRTGWPAEGIWSVTVVTQTAAKADALATALFVMGPEAAIEFCQRESDIRAWIVTPAARSGRLEVHTVGNLPGEWQMVADDLTIIEH